MLKTTFLTALCMTAVSIASTEEEGAIALRTTGYFILDAGYAAETQAASAVAGGTGMQTFKSEPFGDIMGGLRLTAQPSDRLLLTVNPEFKSHYIMPMESRLGGGAEKTQRAKWDAYMEEAKAEWTYPRTRISLGYMVYKENPDAHIFGDYLFRSMIYPGVLFTKFNYPQSQIFGAHVDNNFGGNFRHNLFVLSETRFYPFYDISVAYTASYSFRNLVEIGGGVNLRSVIPVRPSKTTPERGSSVDNHYIQIGLQNATTIRDSAGAAIKIVTIQQVPGFDSTDVIITDSTGAPVSSMRVAGLGVEGTLGGWAESPAMNDLLVNQAIPVELNATRTQYTFAGQLLTFRLSVNPLGFMPKNPMGKDAGKVYLETALLGVKNYPGFYEKQAERMPIMAGIYLPVMNMLDFLTAEIEYYPSKMIPTHDLRAYDNVPQPGVHKSLTPVLNEWSPDARKTKDDWKWGLAAKKSFKGFALVAQAGSDHTKMLDQAGEDYTDIFTRPAHWYFQMRFIGGIY